MYQSAHWTFYWTETAKYSYFFEVWWKHLLTFVESADMRKYLTPEISILKVELMEIVCNFEAKQIQIVTSIL